MSVEETAAARPFLLRRAWVGWTVAAIVLTAGMAGNALVLRDRSSAADQLALVRGRVPATEAEIDRLRREAEDLRASNNSMLTGLRRCWHDLQDRIVAYNKLADEYNALEFLPEGEEAASLRDRFAALRDRDRKLLRRCRNAAAAEPS